MVSVLITCNIKEVLSTSLNQKITQKSENNKAIRNPKDECL